MKKIKLKFLYNYIITSLVGLCVSGVIFYTLQYCQLGLDNESVKEFIDLNTTLTALQIIVIFIIYNLFYFLFNSKFLSSALLLIVGTLIGFATYLKLEFRGEPVYPSDIAFFRDAAFFVDIVSLKLIISFVLVIIFFLVSCFFIWKKNRNRAGVRTEKVIRVCGIAVMSLLIVYLAQFNQPGNKVKAVFNEYATWVSYSQEKNYSRNGVVSGLLYNLKSPALDRPENYSETKIKEIYQKYAKEADIINSERHGSDEDVNIIFIMSESFSDAHQLEGITIKGEDSLKNYREISKNYIHGQALSPAYGGGTANVEFEALTGISLEPLSGTISVPYIDLSDQFDELPSITNHELLKDHKLTSIHPHNSTMYKRIDNYKSLGFNEMIFRDDMKYTETIENNPYISDESAYQEVLDVLKKSDEKDFIHLVTMQNHMTFSGRHQNINYEVEGSANEEEAINYLKGIQYSDVALKEFLNELDQFDEKVLIVFWGDHLPSFYGSKIVELNGYQKMHETPLLFYTNYLEEVNDIGTISPIYFINHVLSYTESKVTPFVALLEKMEDALPAFEKTFYSERETGNHDSRKNLKPSTQLLLNEYDLILYDITTGKNYSKKLGFY